MMMDELEQKKSALEDVSPRVDAMNLDMQGLRERVLEHEQTIATLQVRVLSYHSRNHSRFGSFCARIFIKWVDIHAWLGKSGAGHRAGSALRRCPDSAAERLHGQDYLPDDKARRYSGPFTDNLLFMNHA